MTIACLQSRHNPTEYRNKVTGKVTPIYYRLFKQVALAEKANTMTKLLLTHPETDTSALPDSQIS